MAAMQNRSIMNLNIGIAPFFCYIYAHFAMLNDDVQCIRFILHMNNVTVKLNLMVLFWASKHFKTKLKKRLLNIMHNIAFNVSILPVEDD